MERDEGAGECKRRSRGKERIKKGENAIEEEHQRENIYVYIVGENVCETCLYPLTCSRRGPFYLSTFFCLFFYQSLNHFPFPVMA